MKGKKKHEVGFATSFLDRLRVYRLRNRAFRGHVNTGRFFDYNEHDKGAKHLVVRYNGKIVGTYRIREDNFYSETMFDMKKFLALPGKKIEVSRACIDPNHGGTMSLKLLWDGLFNYMKRERVHYLLSCVSIFASDPSEMAGVWELVKQKSVANLVTPRSTKDFLGFKPIKRHIAKKLLTPILRGYFRLGGKIYGTPAFEKCYGVLVVLRMKDVEYN